MSVLLDRGADLDRLRGAVRRAAAGRGAVAAIEGPPGIGKTRLGEETATLARAAGMTVLSASGGELERDFGFGVVRQLFEPVGETLRFEGAAALAAPALGLEDAAEGEDAPFSVVHGLYWLTANLAPVAVWVDDLQWADRPSRRFLAYLARRLADLPALLVVGVRPALPGEDRAEIDAICSARETLLIEPGPLSAAAIARLAEDRLGRPSDAAFVEECRRVTGGNALLVEELLAEVEQTGAASELATTGAERVARGVHRRLGALPSAAAELAQAVAVLGDGCGLDVAAELARLAGDDAASAAEALIAADILTGAAAMRFRHPLVRAAVTAGLAPVEGTNAHGRAARIVAARGAPAAVAAAHLLLSRPAADAWAVEVLREAAGVALRQGAPELAVRHLRRALDEPPRASERTDVLLALGEAEERAGLPSAEERMREAIALIDDPGARAHAGLRLATALYDRQRWREAADVARAARADADRELDLSLQALLADCVRMDPAAGDDEPEQLRRLAETLGGDTRAEQLVLATAASITPVDTAADHAAAAELVDRFVEPGRTETGVVSNFIRAGRLEQAERVVERSMDAARARGLVRQHGLMLSMRGWIALERGALAAAEEDLREALDLAQDIDLSPVSVAAMLAVALAERGKPAAAGEILERFAAGALPEQQVMNVALYFRARVRMAQGRTDDALADALEVGRRYERIGLRRAVPPWRSLAAVLRADRELAQEELELAERWGTPLARALALRALGLVDGDVALLQAAVEELEDGPWRLELARARVDLGAALRRVGSRVDARGPLGAGMDLAAACGARALAERARTELLATGARPRRLALTGAGSLTPSERRVCELAAGGRTNREIAQDLFVTASTVETHLRHAYRKLGLRSRDELAAVLGDSSR